jgi:hypothetical protein
VKKSAWAVAAMWLSTWSAWARKPALLSVVGDRRQRRANWSSRLAKSGIHAHWARDALTANHGEVAHHRPAAATAACRL